MISPFNKIIGKNSTATSAEVIDGHLTLSLLNATAPKIWRTPLDKIGSASFELKQASDSAITKLILKPKKGTAEIIAEFQTKEDAFAALNAASNALQNSEIQTKETGTKQSATTPVQPSAHKNTSQKSSKWVFVFWGLVIVIGLYYYMTTLIPDQVTDFGQTTSSFDATSASPQDAVGVPVSADDFLNGL